MRYAPETSAERIDALLKTVDFSKPETVKNAYEAISKMSIGAFLWDLLFYGGDHASGVKAFANLALHKCAETAGADSSSIPGRRDMALQTLKGGITCYGQEALASNLDGTVVADNSFAKYFTLEDRRALAVDTLLTKANNSMEAQKYAEAEKTYGWAKDAYTLLKLPRMAADACHASAAASVKAGELLKGAHRYLLAHTVYVHQNLLLEAADCRLEAAVVLLSMRSQDPHDVAAHHAEGKKEALNAATDYARQGLHEQAKKARQIAEGGVDLASFSLAAFHATSSVVA
ncbi:hypothetical protein MB84_28715 (plasmid) [Pandoraea oxalativorans]|uniref:Uncharacterized protein n=2 Tax=Pandoraea oxalativorans TaxID=573737 RepID=A0A0G3IFV8_9BURK|nr:hypothetical protein MB84_28715 [Pandoraea oxalativorans]